MARRLGGNGKESDATGPTAASRSAAAVSAPAPLYLDVTLCWAEALWWPPVVLALHCVASVFFC